MQNRCLKHHAFVEFNPLGGGLDLLTSSPARYHCATDAPVEFNLNKLSRKCVYFFIKYTLFYVNGEIFRSTLGKTHFESVNSFVVFSVFSDLVDVVTNEII